MKKSAEKQLKRAVLQIAPPSAKHLGRLSTHRVLQLRVGGAMPCAMDFLGNVEPAGRLRIVRIPFIDGMTQARNRAEVLVMAVDLVRCMLEDDDFPIQARFVSRTHFVLSTNRCVPIVALAIHRQLQAQKYGPLCAE